MNEDTIVSVHGYSGDAHLIRNFLPWFGHHECPVLVLSPEDAPITDVGPGGVMYRQGGKRAHVGPLSLDRQLRHMEILLEYPHHWFLMNDSDSVLLDPKIPDYVYSDPNTIWSNMGEDNLPDRPWIEDWPHLYSQPPYFCHRSAIEKMLAVAPRVNMDPVRPFIDFFMVQLPHRAGIRMQPFRPSSSCVTNEPLGLSHMRDMVLNYGANFVHAIKSLDVLHLLLGYRREYLRSHR